MLRIQFQLIDLYMLFKSSLFLDSYTSMYDYHLAQCIWYLIILLFFTQAHLQIVQLIVAGPHIILFVLGWINMDKFTLFGGLPLILPSATSNCKHHWFRRSGHNKCVHFPVGTRCEVHSFDDVAHRRKKQPRPHSRSVSSS